MISFTESDGQGMSITTVYHKDMWGTFFPLCELVDVDDEWTIDTNSETTIISNPKGDKHEYLDALLSKTNAPIDKNKPLLTFKSAFTKFDVWEVVRDDNS